MMECGPSVYFSFPFSVLLVDRNESVAETAENPAHGNVLVAAK